MKKILVALILHAISASSYGQCPVDFNATLVQHTCSNPSDTKLYVYQDDHMVGTIEKYCSIVGRTGTEQLIFLQNGAVVAQSALAGGNLCDSIYTACDGLNLYGNEGHHQAGFNGISIPAVDWIYARPNATSIHFIGFVPQYPEQEYTSLRLAPNTVVASSHQQNQTHALCADKVWTFALNDSIPLSHEQKALAHPMTIILFTARKALGLLEWQDFCDTICYTEPQPAPAFTTKDVLLATLGISLIPAVAVSIGVLALRWHRLCEGRLASTQEGMIPLRDLP